MHSKKFQKFQEFQQSLREILRMSERAFLRGFKEFRWFSERFKRGFKYFGEFQGVSAELEGNSHSDFRRESFGGLSGVSMDFSRQ